MRNFSSVTSFIVAKATKRAALKNPNGIQFSIDTMLHLRFYAIAHVLTVSCLTWLTRGWIWSLSYSSISLYLQKEETLKILTVPQDTSDVLLCKTFCWALRLWDLDHSLALFHSIWISKLDQGFLLYYSLDLVVVWAMKTVVYIYFPFLRKIKSQATQIALLLTAEAKGIQKNSCNCKSCSPPPTHPPKAPTWSRCLEN